MTRGYTAFLQGGGWLELDRLGFLHLPLVSFVLVTVQVDNRSLLLL
jgi:hypothetical protein